MIVATGQLHQPAVPRLPGRFEGHSFHSAEWDHGYDLRGKRVAVIGTGASAVQFLPPVAEQAAQHDRLPAHGQLVRAAPQPAYPPPGGHWSSACPPSSAAGGRSCSGTSSSSR